MNEPKTLYIMCGVAGSGKSTLAANMAWPGHSAIISRDEVRFSIVSENEAYFSKEKEVKKEYFRQIKEALSLPWVYEVYADATHLTPASRGELVTQTCLDEVLAGKVLVTPVVVNPDLETCLAQNARRQGRAKVPDSVIVKMHSDLVYPDYDTHKFDYHEIID